MWTLGLSPHLGSLSLVVLLGLAQQSSAQGTGPLFRWQFSDTSVGTTLRTCTTLPITITQTNPAGSAARAVAPYYLTAFVVGQQPTTSLVGTSDANAQWRVNPPVGSEVLFSLMDSAGNAGGVSASVYTVVAGDDVTCVRQNDNPRDFFVISNVTSSLATCDTWGFSIGGGTPPYTLSLAAPDSTVVTNITLLASQNAYSYVNRAAPGGRLLGAVSDSSHRWAWGTPIVSTSGISDVTCGGRESLGRNVGAVAFPSNAVTQTPGTTTTSGGTTTQTSQSGLNSPSTSKSSSLSTGALAGIIVAIVVLVLAIIGAWFFIRRRQKRAKEEEDIIHSKADVTPHAFLSDHGAAAPSTATDDGATLSYAQSPQSTRAPVVSEKARYRSAYTSASSEMSGTALTSPDRDQGSTAAFAGSTGPASVAGASVADSGAPTTTTASGEGSTVSSSPPRRKLPRVANVQEEDEVVIQHRDAGPAQRVRVSELPPPYERGLESP